MKCIVHNCTNDATQGQFVGELCSPCYEFIVNNKGAYSQAYRNAFYIATTQSNVFRRALEESLQLWILVKEELDSVAKSTFKLPHVPIELINVALRNTDRGILERLEQCEGALKEIAANAQTWYETQTEMKPAHRELFKMIATRAKIGTRSQGG